MGRPGLYAPCMVKPYPSIAAIVTTYRTGPALSDCLRALSQQAEVTEIMVIDNGDRAAEAALLDRLVSDTGIRVLRPGRNLGFAAACNLGARMTSARLLAFVNPDLVLPPGSMARVLDVLAEHPDAWLLGGRLLDGTGKEQRGGRRETLTPWRAVVEATRVDRLFPNHPYFRRFNLMDEPAPTGVVEVPAISGAFMIIPRHRFETLGGMDENMFLHIEDVDLCIRVLKAGGRILYCGNVPVYHCGGTSDCSRCFVEWHKARGAVHYFFKHFRGTYPDWALRLVALLLWMRFAVVVTATLPRDAARLVRRLWE